MVDDCWVVTNRRPHVQTPNAKPIRTGFTLFKRSVVWKQLWYKGGKWNASMDFRLFSLFEGQNMLQLIQEHKSIFQRGGVVEKRGIRK